MQGSAVAALPLRASSSAFGFVFSMCLSVCNTHTYSYTHACMPMFVCVCARTQSREFCVSSSSALCARGGAGQHAQQTHFLHVSRAFGFLSLTHTQLHIHRKKKQQKKRKHAQAPCSALPHSLSLSTLRSLWLALLLSRSLLCLAMCACVCVFVCWQFVNVGVAASCVFIISCLAVPCASWSSQSQQKAAETTSESRRCVSNNKITITIFFVFSRLVHLQHQKSKEVGAKKRKTQSKKKQKKI